MQEIRTQEKGSVESLVRHPLDENLFRSNE